ncbi:hypothetical protein CELD12_31730 [Cellulomonas sp. NTE-D12]|nr:hypothetical protein CELD12_31730 [Cellulomonas sp. NTE-D12]
MTAFFHHRSPVSRIRMKWFIPGEAPVRAASGRTAWPRARAESTHAGRLLPRSVGTTARQRRRWDDDEDAP